MPNLKFDMYSNLQISDSDQQNDGRPLPPSTSYLKYCDYVRFVFVCKMC